MRFSVSLKTLVLLMVLFVSPSCESSKEVPTTPQDDDPPAGEEGLTSTSSSDAIEENPDYEGGSDAGGDDDEDGGNDSEDEDNESVTAKWVNAASTKAKIDVVLLQSKKKYNKTLKYVKKNRGKITLALAIFAFRLEIRKAMTHIIKNEIMDPKTGKLRMSPTNILKLLLFVDFMKRLQSGRNASQPGFQAIVNLGESNPVMGLLFNRVLRVPIYNPAFVPPISQHYTFERINERYIKDGMALHKAIHSKHTGFKWPTVETAITSSMMGGNRMPTSTTTGSPSSNETIVVVDMTGLDSGLSTMEQIRDQISFLVSQYRAAAMINPTSSDRNTTDIVVEEEPMPLEVVVLLESPGGITLTICVDKVAASGGYMMACAASPGKLYAAPFAIVGSIGVIGQIINVQKLLEGWGLTPLVFRGGKDKVPLGIVGEVTEDGKAKTQAMIDMTHKAFQELVVNSRPILGKYMKKVGTGDVFLGKGAIDVGLIDEIMTSDEYLTNKVIQGARVLKLVKNRKARFPFATNFDNYDTATTTIKDSFSIWALVWNAGRSMTRWLGFPTSGCTSSPMLRHEA